MACTFSNPPMFLTRGMCNAKRGGEAENEPGEGQRDVEAVPGDAEPAVDPPPPPGDAEPAVDPPPPPPPAPAPAPAPAPVAREEAIVRVASGESSFENSEMQADIVQHDQEALSQSYCIKCRSGNVLRKCSFPRETSTLQHLVEWVCAVHNIPLG